MKIATWDSGDPEMYFDNPNLRWGNPSYLLEPGDPGYVNPFPSVPEPKTKTKRMRRNAYYPVRQGDQITWHVNFSDKLPGHAAALGLAAGPVAAAVADCKWQVYVMQNWLSGVRSFSLAATDALAETQTGIGAAAQELPVFTAPALPAGVVAVNPGVLTRIFALVQVIKDGGKCTEAIASDLGIVGSEATAPDLNTVQPVLTATVGVNENAIKWGWGGNRAWLDACEILVDRNDGKGYVLLTIDTTPNYTDTEPHPATLTKWTYKAIYRAGDKQVGLWSNPVSVTVGG